MKKYVFIFSIDGDIDIESNNQNDAKEQVNNLSDTEILKVANSNGLNIKCIGERNEDGSIKYFNENKKKDKILEIYNDPEIKEALSLCDENDD